MILNTLIMNSVDNEPVVTSLYTGYDDDFTLLFNLDHTDRQSPLHSNRVSCRVVKDEAYGLAMKLGVSMVDLPGRLADMFTDFSQMENPQSVDVDSCFSEVLNMLVDFRCPYKIHRSKL